MTEPTLRQSAATDRGAILALYPRAFPEEDLTPLVSTLLSGDWPILSLIQTEDDRVLGHLLFTLFDIHDPRDGALLGPLCVDPDRQGAGMGGTLLRTGLDRLAARGVRQVFVLGDPGFYGRFGFGPDHLRAPPYDLPAAWAGAWQSRRLTADGPSATGPIALPAPWMRPALWRP